MHGLWEVRQGIAATVSKVLLLLTIVVMVIVVLLLLVGVVVMRLGVNEMVPQTELSVCRGSRHLILKKFREESLANLKVGIIDKALKVEG